MFEVASGMNYQSDCLNHQTVWSTVDSIHVRQCVNIPKYLLYRNAPFLKCLCKVLRAWYYLPHARMREVGLSNRYCPSVVCHSSENYWNLVIYRVKWFLNPTVTLEHTKKYVSMYLIVTKALRLYGRMRTLSRDVHPKNGASTSTCMD